MNDRLFVSLWVVLLLAGTSLAQTSGDSSPNSQPSPTSRPAIVGVAHIGLKTDDLAAARKFYTGVLGFQEPFSLDKAPANGTCLLLTYFKVNDHLKWQYNMYDPNFTRVELMEPKPVQKPCCSPIME
jgi:hypothetical protein